MTTKFYNILIALFIGFAPALSNADDTGNSVSQTDARKVNRVTKGVIIQASDATIEVKSGTEATGAAAGSAIGILAGSNLGNGKGSIVGSIAGAVVGGIVGKVGGALFGKQSGQDLVIQLFEKDGSEGEVVSITQAVDDKGKLNDGEAVLVIYRGDQARVIRNTAAAKKAAAAGAATEQAGS